MHTYFGNKFIGIGEDHKGAYGFSFNNDSDVQKLSQLIDKKKTITCWYEGPKVGKKSASFVQFVKDFKAWLKTNNHKDIKIIEKGWELSLRFNRMEEITGILLGAEAGEYKKLIGNQLNGKQTLADAIVKCKAIKGSQSSSVTMPELIKALSNNGKPTDVLQTMQQPNSATVNTLYAIYGGGYGAMRAKYFEGTKGAKKSSSVYKRVNNFNSARDKHLAKLMKNQGGIFLAGDQHIEFIKKYI